MSRRKYQLGVYGPYYGYHWGFVYYSMDTYTTHLGTLGL